MRGRPRGRGFRLVWRAFPVCADRFSAGSPGLAMSMTIAVVRSGPASARVLSNRPVRESGLAGLRREVNEGWLSSLPN